MREVIQQLEGRLLPFLNQYTIYRAASAGEAYQVLIVKDGNILPKLQREFSKALFYTLILLLAFLQTLRVRAYIHNYVNAGIIPSTLKKLLGGLQPVRAQTGAIILGIRCGIGLNALLMPLGATQEYQGTSYIYTVENVNGFPFIVLTIYNPRPYLVRSIDIS